MALLFTTNNQHMCREQNLMLVVPLYITVNLKGPTFCILKSWKSEKMAKFFIYHFVPLKDCKTASHVQISLPQVVEPSSLSQETGVSFVALEASTQIL